MAPSDKNEIYLSASPHYARPINTRMIMLTVVAALLPLCIAGVVFFGMSALFTILVSVVSCVFFEWAFRKITKQDCRTGDCSAAVTGILFALVLPPSFPLWMTVLGAFFAVVVAKEFFGGLGMNVFNPALTGRAFLFVSYPAVMAAWLTPFDAVTTATPLAAGMENLNYLNLFVGSRAGSIGETSAALILLAFVVLLATRVIDWRAPVTMIVTAVLFQWILGTKTNTAFFSGDPLLALMSGGLLFGAVFMTTDYATSPVTTRGRLLFGFGCGFITALIRRFGAYPEGVMFSILIMNALVPFLNRMSGKKYGELKRKGAK